MEGLDEVIKEFLVESYESLDQLDGDLIALEDTPDDRDRLASIFRTVHTIKGTSGFLALPKLERVAHVGENLLVPLRDGELRLNEPIADGLLGMVDAIREILAKLEESGSEGDADYQPLVERLQSLLCGSGDVAGKVVADTESTDKAEDSEPSELNAPDNRTAKEPIRDTPATKRKTTRRKSSKATTKKQPAQRRTKRPTAAAKKKPAATPTHRPPADSRVPAATEDAAPVKPVLTAEPKSDKHGSVADSTVRIDVELLDQLMNLVGELVLARNQVLQISESSQEPSLLTASQRLNLITSELQEGVMKTRMQPIRNAWNKLPRVVRDLSSACKKKVEVRMEGADTELDKTILEAIKDPLTHIVRNSVDHGIESPEVREAAGKPAEGVLLLRAFHEGGQVNIEIIDDGGGINAQRVRDKAIEKGLITAEQANSMGERELTNLILLPGFSTAAAVTNVSGRGVGMDVVKTNIERISGTLEIKSTPGRGTTLRIKIPLTLAIVPALITRTAGDAYAIPQVNLLELVRLDGDRASRDIEFIYSVPVYRLRGRLLPLIFLDEQLGLRSPRCRDDYRESINIVVLQAEDQQFGLVVDSVVDTQEIVVKPLGPHLNEIPAYAGATIMGDGTVALILDVLGIAQQSDVLTEHHDRVLRDQSIRDNERSNETESLLIVDSEGGTRAAIRLSTVARLEKFEACKLERSGNHQVIQYRGEILPLVWLGNSYGDGMDGASSDTLNAVVYSVGDKHVGIVVEHIVDIVQESRQRIEQADGGRCIIRDRVTEIVDLDQIVNHVLPREYDRY